MDQEPVPDRLPLSWLILPWLGFLIAQLAIGTIAAVSQGDPAPVVEGWGWFSSFTQFAIVLYVGGSGIAVGILYLLLRARGMSRAAVGLAGGLTWSGAGLALVGVFAGSVLYLGTEWLLGLVGVPMFWYGGDGSAMGLASVTDVVLVVVFAVLLGPFFEEVLFRGYVLTALIDKGFRPFNAVLLSALIFMSVHVFYGPGVLVFIFLWAFIPALLFLREGRLHAAILFHSMNNALTFILVPLAF